MTPSHAIIRDATKILTVVDSVGRRFTLRRLTALDTLRLFKAAGPVLSQNQSWLSMAGLAFAVLEIEGIPVPPPVTEPQIESLIEKLGDEGLAAVADAIKDEPDSFAFRADVGN